MAFFSEEEKNILGGVLPEVAAALRTPLNNLHIAMQRLLSQQEDSTECAIVQQSYYRMLRLVNNLSAAPELLSDERLETENTELVVWLDELCRQAASIAREIGVEVEFVCRCRYLVAAVNRVYFERMVWNLLSNAMKATSGGGRITVTLEDRGQIFLLSVRDSGCGLPPEGSDAVFRRWTQQDAAAPQQGGLGLGLLICRRVAEGHGGRLLLESRPDGGTMVTAALPHVRRGSGELHSAQQDYAGGFSHVMMELSDALPYRVFTEKHLD